MIEIIKTSASTPVLVGDVITFTMTVENTGIGQLTGVSISEDILKRADGTPLTLTSGPSFVSASGGSPEGTLAVDETATYTATYTLVQADVDAGGISNQATAEGTDESGSLFSDISSDTPGIDEKETIVDIPREGKMTVEKAGALVDANSNGTPDVGEMIAYTFTVANTGNATLTDVTVTDTKATVSGGPLASLAVAASDSTTFTGVYTITQADIDAGSFENTASAMAKDPDGNDVTADSNPPGGAPGDPTVVELDQAGAHTLVKEGTLADANSNGRPDAGEVIDYTFTVTNTGNVSLTNIAVSDDKATVSGSPIAGPLAPGAVDSTSVTGTYTVTQADIDAGNVDNHATSTAKDPKGDDVTAQSSPPGGNPGDPTSTTLVQEGESDFVKEATHNDANDNGFVDAG
ncbi:DUF7507 domain-containing protein, partial [Nitratireductor soli]|uniref:DUF7507 domain-containing protein n=1 Tax=Nitratireductor soli TaxID=1670619 RepID=UPI00138F3FEE